MPFTRGMLLAKDIVDRDSGLGWQDGFQQALMAADIESGVEKPNFMMHVQYGDDDMKFDMAISCLRGGMRLTNERLACLRDMSVDEDVPEFVLVYLAVAYDHGGRKPKIDDVHQAWTDIDEENQELKHLRWVVDAGVRAGMILDPDLVALSFPGFAHLCMFATHMNVPYEYFESRCPGLADHRQPDVLTAVAKERDRLAILKAVVRSVPHATWPDYAPVVESFDKYAEAAREVIPALRTEMTAMVLAFRAMFDVAPATRTRHGTRAQLAALPDDIKRRIVDAAARSNPCIGYMKHE